MMAIENYQTIPTNHTRTSLGGGGLRGWLGSGYSRLLPPPANMEQLYNMGITNQTVTGVQHTHCSSLVFSMLHPRIQTLCDSKITNKMCSVLFILGQG